MKGRGKLFADMITSRRGAQWHHEMHHTIINRLDEAGRDVASNCI
jgi:hypothetical protein